MRSNLTKILAAATVAASAAIFCLGTAQAAAVYTFDAALSGNGIDPSTGLPADFTIGDKEFLNFTCLASGVGTDCRNVSFIADTFPTLGVLFNPGAALNLTSIGSRDVLLGFEVRTTDGSSRIADFMLDSNATATGSGSVSDTLEICSVVSGLPSCTPTGRILGPIPLSGTGFFYPDTDLPRGPYNAIWVFDDVATSVGDSPGLATISRLNKVVTQVPEPASLMLISAALLSLGFVRRRRPE